MKLEELLSRHPSVRLASSQDNDRILEFFNSLPMTGKTIDLQYDRSPDFFHFLKFHSDSFFVFLLEDNGSLQGVGTLVIRPGVIRGEEHPVGYLGDLRVKAGKRNAVNWRKFYQDLITNSPLIEELRFTKYFSTVVIDSNKAAQNSLVLSGKNSFQYHLLDRYEMINVYFKNPFLPIKSQYQTRFATKNDKALLKEFFLESEYKKPFGFPELFEFALGNWNRFSIEDFVIVMNKEKIVAMAGLWCPSPMKKIYLRKLSLPLKLMGLFLKLRKNGFPSLEQELKPLYLTHLNYTDPEALKSLINFSLKSPKFRNFHMLSFTYFHSAKAESALAPFVCDKIAMALYQVRDPQVEALKGNELPGFEMALV